MLSCRSEPSAFTPGYYCRGQSVHGPTDSPRVVPRRPLPLRDHDQADRIDTVLRGGGGEIATTLLILSGVAIYGDCSRRAKPLAGRASRARCASRVGAAARGVRLRRRRTTTW